MKWAIFFVITHMSFLLVYLYKNRIRKTRNNNALDSLGKPMDTIWIELLSLKVKQSCSIGSETISW